MKPTPNQLKKANSLFFWYSDDKIDKAVTFLEEKGFYWSGSKKVFYNDEIGLEVSLKQVAESLENQNAFKEEIGKAVESKKMRDYSGEVKIAGAVINLFIFLTIANLFLGWIFLHPFFWISLQLILIFLLVSFLKVRKTLKEKMRRQTYAG